MTAREAVNWLINLTADIGKSEHRDLWHYQQALFEIIDMLEGQSEVGTQMSLPPAQPEPCDDPRADVYYLAEKIGIHRLYALVVELRGEPEPHYDEWCTDCREYDSEKHCCPRFNRVIRDAVEEVKEERIKCAHCKRYDSHGHRCKWWNHGVSNVDWCSYAERKEE